ncbi:MULTISPECIES: DUF5799 family protein [Halorubrum]|jgi:hypothetical protein|uniref:Uncharacterized protein n=2 Tax=Halorubrum ezzemoulense TaxID=337243 RepID=A0A1X4GL06_HALEZ|nr:MULTISPECIES: DUF5799 family protein [Halorubrum]MDB2236851.1 DUF5799 family protein [Halorubrum ezzemoulense]MDB2247160.1 DUF5799 family protein [Halorubrum ezzemoulense]MDB9301192.1 DUF5799 family protein [Halorubrum ezzemoulense]OSO97832.1 hypothetical protein B9H04_11135 [Halorubrum ezzemoulense DSM 17463]OTF10419.1 hypothetical protein B9G38_06370 [Halorubrum sp. SD612]
MSEWTDAIVGERMTVDNQFNERVAASRFSSQEWGLIMTATDLEIENADDPDAARVVADTSNLPAIMPELENLRSQMAGMGGAPGGDSGGSGGGVVDSIKGALGLGGGGGSGGPSDEELEAAERLVQEYADELQAHLEEVGKWEQVRLAYQE